MSTLPDNDIRYDRALYIRELQGFLREISHKDSRVPSVTVDGVFNDETKNAVQAAQNALQLPPTGIVDFRTWTAIVGAARQARVDNVLPFTIAPFTRLTPTLSVGMSDTVLPFVHLMFNGLSTQFQNFYPEAVTERLTPITADNLSEIQRIGALPVNGQLNASTWNILVLAYNRLVPERFSDIIPNTAVT